MIPKLALAALLGALAGTLAATGLAATGGPSMQPDAIGSGALSSYAPKATGRVEAAWIYLRPGSASRRTASPP